MLVCTYLIIVESRFYHIYIANMQQFAAGMYVPVTQAGWWAYGVTSSACRMMWGQYATDSEEYHARQTKLEPPSGPEETLSVGRHV